MTTLEDFSLLYSKLVTVFGEYSKNAGGKCAIYHEKLSHIDYDTMYKAIDSATNTCKRFPSIAELKEIAHNLAPQDGPDQSSHANDEAHFNQRMAVCDEIMVAVNRLPEPERTHIENIANKMLQNNAPDWYTSEMKLRAFQGFCIMTFKQRYPAQADQIKQQIPQEQPYNKPFVPVPFHQPHQITTTIIRNTPLVPLLDAM